MAWSQSDIDALKAAIATGARDVTYSDSSRIVYRNLDEMRQTLGLMEVEVAGSTVKRVRTVHFDGSKAF